MATASVSARSICASVAGCGPGAVVDLHAGVGGYALRRSHVFITSEILGPDSDDNDERPRRAVRR
jgi:hypothetical protein